MDVALYWWRRRGRGNLGDALSPLVVGALSGRKVVFAESRRLIAIGSVLHLATDGDVVWGAGFKYANSTCSTKIEARAVRGPRSRARLLELGVDCPEVYGDPAVLMPSIHRARSTRRIGIGVVPHYRDFRPLRSAIRERGIRFIDVLDEPRRVIDAICACEAIVSTSLHGIIIAEAYGVPAAWAIAGDRVLGGEFKFRDYYEGTGREGTPVSWRNHADMRSAVRAACGIGLARYDRTPLLAAFPFPRSADAEGGG
jgi:pyruvyltransferase